MVRSPFTSNQIDGRCITLTEIGEFEDYRRRGVEKKKQIEFYVNPPTTNLRTHSIYHLFTHDDLIVNQEYQRTSVWGKERKRLLIDSMLRGYSIGTLFLWYRHDKGISEILDGQQRIRTIINFINDGFSIVLNSGRLCYYSALPEDVKDNFDNYEISVTQYRGIDEDEVRQMFLRLQEGVPLNIPEKLNSLDNPLVKVVRELCKHPFIKDLGIQEFRFKKFGFCAATYYSIINGAAHSGGMRMLKYYMNGELKKSELNTVKTTFDIIDEFMRSNITNMNSTVLSRAICLLVAKLAQEGYNKFNGLWDYYLRLRELQQKGKTPLWRTNEEVDELIERYKGFERSLNLVHGVQNRI